MRNQIRYALMAIILLISLALLLWFGLNTFKTKNPQQNFFTVTINGKVSTTDDYLNTITKPNSVRAYPSVYSFNSLCRYDIIDKATNISWQGDIGDYSLTIELPVEQEIIVTPNCKNCHPKRLYVSPQDNLHNINLTWDQTDCTEDAYDFADTDSLLETARRLMDTTSQEFDRIDFGNESIEGNIRHTLVRGRNEITAAGQTNSNDEKLFHSMYAVLSAWRVFNRNDLGKLHLCLQEIKSQTSLHNDTCYTPVYEGYVIYESVNATFNSHAEDLQRYGRAFSSNEIEQLRNEINYEYGNKRERIQTAERRCETALALISDSFNFQKPYCERRSLTLNVFNWSLALAALIIGMLWGKFGRRWDE